MEELPRPRKSSAPRGTVLDELASVALFHRQFGLRAKLIAHAACSEYETCVQGHGTAVLLDASPTMGTCGA